MHPEPNPTPGEPSAEAPGLSKSGLPTSIGGYPVERELGRGGMGVVYLARDPKLGRQVAIKVLPAAFSADPTRLTRFEREARTLASMNHRNIAMIFGLEKAAGELLLVLEYVPGVTLSTRLARGALAVDESMRIGIQIAEGLEVAHDLGIVHRDLKPDNVRLTPESVVKVLDFGLATSATKADSFNEGATTAGSGLTVQGMVMGTPGYMSPEQARGLPTDRRTDIWAFGCVLFEMLSGVKAFWGETVTDALAAILDREPDYAHLPPRTPNRVRELIRKCLVKDQRRRLRDIGDARLEMEEILTQPQSGWYKSADAAQPSRPRVVARLVMPLQPPPAATVNAAGQSAALGLSGTYAALPEGLSPGVKIDMSLCNSPRGGLAVSPDGATVAVIVGQPPQTQLAIRRMEATDLRLIPGTSGAEGPTFNPDGSKIAFFEGGKLKVVSLTGGVATTIAAAPRPGGATWSDDGFIYFVPDWQKPLMRVPQAGGSAEAAATPDLAAGELALLMPEALPGGRYLLATVWTGTGFDSTLVVAIDLRSGQRRPLILGGSNPHYAPSGHLVFSRGASLCAVVFDADRLEIHGQPIVVEQGVLGHAQSGASQFGLGADGTLAFAPGALWEPSSELIMGEREGELRVLPLEKRAYAGPAVSPDGRWLIVESGSASDHLYLVDLARASASTASPTAAGPEGIAVQRVTHHGDNRCAVFAPGSKRIVFQSTMGGQPELYGLQIDPAGAAPELVLSLPGRSLAPCCVTAGGLVIFAATRPAPASGVELWAVDPSDQLSARPLFTGPASCWGADVSPDGKLIAFVSDETGRAEVYVQPMPGPGSSPGTSALSPAGSRRLVSSAGGAGPLWSATGGELYFWSGDTITAVRIAVEPALLIGRPRQMATCPAGTLKPSRDSRNYALIRDAHDLMLVRSGSEASRASTLNVALNWFEELRRRLPVPEKPGVLPSAPINRMGPPSQGTRFATMPTRMTPGGTGGGAGSGSGSGASSSPSNGF